MKDFLEYAVKELVEFPGEVQVQQVDSERSTVYELRLNKGDVGKIIGKRGRTIQALRTLVNGAAGKPGKRATVEIIEGKASFPETPALTTPSVSSSSPLSPPPPTDLSPPSPGQSTNTP